MRVEEPYFRSPLIVTLPKSLPVPPSKVKLVWVPAAWASPFAMPMVASNVSWPASPVPVKFTFAPAPMASP